MVTVMQQVPWLSNGKKAQCCCEEKRESEREKCMEQQDFNIGLDDQGDFHVYDVKII